MTPEEARAERIRHLTIDLLLERGIRRGPGDVRKLGTEAAITSQWEARKANEKDANTQRLVMWLERDKRRKRK